MSELHVGQRQGRSLSHPTCTSSLTRPMRMMLGLETGISSMISTVVSLVRKGTAGRHDRRS